MGTVSVSLPSDGETIEVADYNTPITTIVNEINGELDNSNIATAAAIAGSKIADTTVTAGKIDFASFVHRQNITTNTTIGSVRILTGWGYVVGDTTNAVEATITFPVTFAQPPIVVASYAGAAGSIPDTVDDLSSGPGNNQRMASSYAPSTTGVSISIGSSSTLGNTTYFGYTWIAIGNV